MWSWAIQEMFTSIMLLLKLAVHPILPKNWFLSSTKTLPVIPDTLTSIVCDGTNVNTGRKQNVIRLVEEQLFKPLQWLVCLLHCNELPLRALIKKFDGETSGPRGFKGPLGKKLSFDHKTLEIADYPPISTSLIKFKESATNNLSTDQQYLLVASNAVALGKDKLDPDT